MTEAEFRKRVLIHSGMMYACAYSLLRDPHEASDCVQEVCIKLWDVSERLSAVDNIGSYCVQSVRRKCIDVIRTRGHKEFSSLESIKEIKESEVTDDYKRDRKEDLSVVYTLLEELPDNQRRVVELSGISGLSNREIEEVTGLSGDNVRVLLSRGRKRLKELFKKKG